MRYKFLGQLAGFAALLAIGSQADALTSLDFESGFTGSETAIAGTEFIGTHDLSFSTNDAGLRVVQTRQSDAIAFYPFNNPYDWQTRPLGDYFLSGDFNLGTDLTIMLEGIYALQFQFDIVDIDYNETFTFVAKDTDDNVIDTQVIVGTAANDRRVDTVSFVAPRISHIEVTGVASNGNGRHVGFGYDNFSWVVGGVKPNPPQPPVVPLPAGLVLGMSAFGALAVVRYRRRS